MCQNVYKYENEEEEVHSRFSINSAKEGIILYSSWLGGRDDSDFFRAVNYMGIAEDVDNYLGY